MKKRIPTNWGKWVRERQSEKSIVDEVQKISKLSMLWSVAAIIIIILFASAGIFLNYFLGSRSSEKIDASTRQMLRENKESIQKTLNAMNPNDFFFKPLEDSDWYTPTPINEYVALNVLPVQSREISLYFSIKNRFKRSSASQKARNS